MDQKIAPAGESERITFNMREVARILGLSNTATFYAIKRGDIPHIRIGKRILIPRAGLERLLEQR